MKPNAAIAFFVFFVFLIISSALYHALASDMACRYETRVYHTDGGGVIAITYRICCDVSGQCTETAIRRR